VQQYFLSKLILPPLMVGGVYNRIQGENWSDSWLWPRCANLKRKQIHKSIRHMYPREDTSWDSEDDDQINVYDLPASRPRDPLPTETIVATGGITAAASSPNDMPVTATKRGRRGRPKGTTKGTNHNASKPPQQGSKKRRQGNRAEIVSGNTTPTSTSTIPQIPLNSKKRLLTPEHTINSENGSSKHQGMEGRQLECEDSSGDDEDTAARGSRKRQGVERRRQHEYVGDEELSRDSQELPVNDEYVPEDDEGRLGDEERASHEDPDEVWANDNVTLDDEVREVDEGSLREEAKASHEGREEVWVNDNVTVEDRVMEISGDATLVHLYATRYPGLM